MLLFTAQQHCLSEIQGTMQLMFCAYLFSWGTSTGNWVHGIVPVGIFVLLFRLTEIYICVRGNKVRELSLWRNGKQYGSCLFLLK